MAHRNYSEYDQNFHNGGEIGYLYRPVGIAVSQYVRTEGLGHTSILAQHYLSANKYYNLR